jgi:HAD superfamily hydrolase (TIGR01509 family)
MNSVLKRVDLLITDIGGVLVKTDEAIFSLIKTIVAAKGIPGGSIEAILKVLGTSIRNYVHAYLPDSYKHRTEECYQAFCKAYPEQVRSLLKPFDGVNDTLHFLKSHGLIIVAMSCMSSDEMKTCLSSLSFQGFDITTSYEGRPDPAGLQDLMARFQATPKRTIYAGDAKADIQMGKNAGVIAVAVKTGALGVHNPRLLEAENPDYLLERFMDVPGIVLQKYNMD